MPKVSPLTRKLIKDYYKLQRKDGSVPAEKVKKFKETFLFFTFNSIKSRLSIRSQNLSEKEKDLLLRTALKQTFFGSPGKMNKRKKNLLRHPLFRKLLKFCKSQKTLYLLLNDLVKSNPKKANTLLDDPEKTREKIMDSYKERFVNVREELLEYLAYASLVLLFLLTVAFFILEGGSIASAKPVIGIVVPTSLVLLFSLFLKNPPEKNEKKLLLDVFDIIYKKEETEPVIISSVQTEKPFFYALVTVSYAAYSLLVIALGVWAISLLGYPLLYAVILMASLSVTSFIGLKARERVREFYSINIKSNLLDALVESLAFPLQLLEKHLLPLFSLKKVSLPRPSSINTSNRKERWKEYLRKKKESIYQD